MRRLLMVLLLFCLPPAITAALPPDLERSVDAVFAEWSSVQTPGCAVNIFSGQQSILARGYGMADLEHHVAVSTGSVFGLQSASKQFVAMATILLAQEGKLSLEDDVRKYIPELPDYGATITIRQLLDHSSGLRDTGILLQDQGWSREEALTRAHVMRLITRQRHLNHAPGVAASYTNTGYYLLPIIVERVSGKSFAAFAEERIFQPLGMNHTLYRDTAESVIPDRVVGYSRGEDGRWRISASAKNEVFTTVEDLAAWNANFIHPRVGGEAAIQAMTTWGKLAGGYTSDFGLGLSPLSYRGLTGAYYHGGDSSDGTSLFARFPAQNLAFAIMCNGGMTFRAETLAMKLTDLLLADEIRAAEAIPGGPPPDPPGIKTTTAELQRVAGLYFTSQAGPLTRQFQVKEGKLFVLPSPDRSVELIPVGPGRFHATHSSTEYAFAGNQVRRITPDAPPLEFVRVDPQIRPAVDDYAGIFWSDEVEAEITFKTSGGKLWYAMPGQETPGQLTPIFRDAFRDGELVFRFHRDRRGRVDGLTKHWDRVWSLGYVKK